MRQTIVVVVVSMAILGSAAAALSGWPGPPSPTTAAAEQWRMLATVHDASALQALRQAARNGSVDAQRVLGTVLVSETDAASAQEGQTWLEKAARAHDVKAQLALGKLLFKGAPGVAPDYARARAALQAAATAGDKGAAYYLGLVYKAGGAGMAADAQTAARWFQAAASDGVAEAQFILGQMLLEGDGVAPDAVAARGWFEKAGEQEHPEANLQLLMARSRGEMGFAIDDAATARQFMEAQHSLRHRPPPP